MSDFEQRLREGLDRAAEQAPAFTGLAADAGPSSDGRRFSWRAPLLVAAALALLAGGVGLWAVLDGPDQGGDAGCAAIVVYDGTRYVGAGGMEGLERMPRLGEVIGEARDPGCDDGNGAALPRTLEVRALHGVAPATAVMADDNLYVAESLARWPDELAPLRQPVRCANDITVVTGDWISYEGPMPEQDAELAPPYIAVIVADHGAGLPLERWASVTLRVKVTDATVGGTDAELVKAALQGGRPITAAVHCDDGAFVADRLALTGG